MSADILLGLIAHLSAAGRICVEICHCLGELLWGIFDLHHGFRLRDSLGAYGSGHDGRSVVKCLDYLSFDACAIPQRYHHDPGSIVKLCQFFFADKALDDHTVAWLL